LASAEGEDSLLGDLRHATGNLLQRMRYWTSLLEGEALGVHGAEAVAELRSSFDGLQALVTGTMELLRTSEVRHIAIRAADLVRAIELRFETRSDAASLSSDAQVFADAALLDRALTLVSEVVLPLGADAPCPASTVIAGVDASDASSVRLRVTVQAYCARLDRSELYGVIREEMNLALAKKLLAETGCSFTWARHEGIVSFEIALPLAASTENVFRALRNESSGTFA